MMTQARGYYEISARLDIGELSVSREQFEQIVEETSEPRSRFSRPTDPVVWRKVMFSGSSISDNIPFQNIAKMASDIVKRAVNNSISHKAVIKFVIYHDFQSVGLDYPVDFLRELADINCALSFEVFYASEEASG